MKLKICKVCDNEFKPFQTMQKVCSPACAVRFGQIKAEEKFQKEQRKRLKIDREKLKTKKDWLNDAQLWFNKFVRLRDRNLPCISCQRLHQGQYHAGHYKSRGAHPELAFDENNCHKQCSSCNGPKSGNIIEYRKNLINKIGIEEVERIEGPNTAKHYSIDDAKRLIEIYKRKAKQLESINKGESL